MPDRPGPSTAPLPRHAEAQLDALLHDFRSHHAQRRRQRRTAGSAALFAAVLIGTCAVWLRLTDDAARQNTPHAPIMVERHDSGNRDVAPSPPALPQKVPGTNVHIVRLDGSQPSTVRIVQSTVTTTRIDAAASTILRIGDDEALRMLEATGRSTGIIRIGDRVMLADEVRGSTAADDTRPTSQRAPHPHEAALRFARTG